MRSIVLRTASRHLAHPFQWKNRLPWHPGPPPTSESSASRIFRAIPTDILHFPERVLVIQAARGCSRAATLLPDTVLPIYSCDDAVPGSTEFCRQTHGSLRSPSSERLEHSRGHAAALIDGHVWQAADRLASTRARRAAAARAVRSAGTSCPVPKYISSGVCPRTPSEEARDCVRRRRTRPVDGRW